ncbi:MAG: LAGLIDADG family homing endonuclease [Candidatus Woesearchaeota archaeon]|jgi:hypothetical protein|nr:LAGLIDADG family homing endonuclease [Candidatus Woesearchaeota archaeon]
MNKIPIKTINEIKQIYIDDKSSTLTDLAKRFSISRERIKKRLVKGGIDIRSNQEIADFKKEEAVENLCKLYNKIMSLRKVRKLTGHSINFIKRCIKGKVQFPIYPRPLKEEFDKVTKEKVRIYAHSIFDGHVSHSKGNSYIVGYTNKCPELLREFGNDVEYVYGIKKGEYLLKSGVTNLIYSSKLMYLDILNFNKSIVKEDPEYKKVYLRAFFDDEGCVIFNPSKGKFFINGKQHNQKEILFIKSLLDDFGIGSKVYKFVIEITLNKSIIEYSKLIGFTHPEKRRKILTGIAYYEKKFRKINNQNLRIKKFTLKGMGPYQISKLIGMPPTTIRHRIDSGFKSIKYDYG